jgi:hypothetical protein
MSITSPPGLKARPPAVLLAIVATLGLVHGAAQQPPTGLGPPDIVAPGVELYQTADALLVDTAGPIAVSLVKLDPSRARVSTVLARDGEVLGTDTVEHIAQRSNAIAAVNGGYFNAGNHEPIGILKVAGELVSDGPLATGAVAIRSPAQGRTALDFDQIAVTTSLEFSANGRPRMVPIDGVDTTRVRGKLMLYTPMYHADSDTAPTGTEWALDGSPLRVADVRPHQGKTTIPRHGAVLSFGGTDLPPDLAALAVGTRVAIRTAWSTRFGLTAARLDESESVVSGAGLLRAHGRQVSNWPAAERLGEQAFVNARHPRTIIGIDAHGSIWLAAVDGRQLSRSIGMTFTDLERLCDRLGLTDALNLDGGSSTSMVVRGRVVNHPAEPGKEVSNAVVVTLR